MGFFLYLIFTSNSKIFHFVFVFVWFNLTTKMGGFSSGWRLRRTYIPDIGNCFLLDIFLNSGGWTVPHFSWKTDWKIWISFKSPTHSWTLWPGCVCIKEHKPSSFEHDPFMEECQRSLYHSSWRRELLTGFGDFIQKALHPAPNKRQDNCHGILLLPQDDIWPIVIKNTNSDLKMSRNIWRLSNIPLRKVGDGLYWLSSQHSSRLKKAH